MRVVITGAAGRIGREIAEELSEAHELCLIDKRPVPGLFSITADLSKIPSPPWYMRWLGLKSVSWVEHMKDADVVVHLAANASTETVWEKVLRDNVEATWNVIESAAKLGVPRVVFASSNWAVKAVENKLAPLCYQPTGPKIDSGMVPGPLTAYGLSKAFGELAGRMFVEEKKLESFVAARLGNYNSIPSTDEIVRARWIGVDDTRSLFKRCVEAEFDGFHVVYGVSAQKTAPYNLSHTHQMLSWLPRQVPDRP